MESMEPQARYAEGSPQAACPDARLQERRPAWRGRGRLIPPIDSARARRAGLLAHSIWLLILTVVYLLASPDPVLAADTAQPPVIHLTGPNQNLEDDLVLQCPQGGVTEPKFKNQKTGGTFPVADPRLRAVAEKACGQALGASTGASQGSVKIVNQTGAAIWVGFSGSSITWGSGCQSSGPGTVEIPASGTCQATVPSTNTSSRFCASPTSGALNCTNAQQNHQTLIETNFQPDCFGTSNSCIWYDISVIPLNPVPSGYGYCTDCTWNGNRNDPTCTPPPTNANSYCADTGKIAYNFPVMLSCSGEPTYTCKGPLSTQGPSGVTYGEAYPSNCGNPNATCACGSPACQAPPNCVAAYFYPMFYPPENVYQPNAVCPNGQTLTITFLSGP